MKKLFLSVFTMIILTTSPIAFTMDKETDVEIRALRGQLSRMTDKYHDLLTQVRNLERTLGKDAKQIDHLTKKVGELTDDLVHTQNVDIANIKSGQKRLYDQIDVLNWGSKERDCDKIKAKHQQINAVQSEDGAYTLRYLCFDGVVVHLQTEVNLPPQ